MASVISVENLSKKYIIGHRKISLNGAILGMSLTEIKSKFDELVVFEVKEAFDTSVKHSSRDVRLKLTASYGFNPISYPVGSESPSGFHPNLSYADPQCQLRPPCLSSHLNSGWEQR